jgi:hypothetical protein
MTPNPARFANMAAWVIARLQEVAERCMQRDAITGDNGEPFGEYHFNAAGARRAVLLRLR